MPAIKSKPATRKAGKSEAAVKSTTKAASKKAGKAAGKGVTLDIVFSGPLLFVPATEAGKIISVDVYCPRNGHSMGAVFVPGVYFTDDELNNPAGSNWPEAASFSLLDPHSYHIELSQKGKTPGFPAASIPGTNHKVRPGRKLSSDWDSVITVSGKLSGWGSHRHVDVGEGLFSGSDAPTVAQVAGLHRLTYASVTAAEFCGLKTNAKDYLSANIGKGGTLIVIGEIPYESSMLHERLAVDALAKLAGLDLRLVAEYPPGMRTRLMHHVDNCGISTILA